MYDANLDDNYFIKASSDTLAASNQVLTKLI